MDDSSLFMDVCPLRELEMKACLEINPDMGLGDNESTSVYFTPSDTPMRDLSLTGTIDLLTLDRTLSFIFRQVIGRGKLMLPLFLISQFANTVPINVLKI